jgi:hypothetical protein
MAQRRGLPEDALRRRWRRSSESCRLLAPQL